MNLPPPLTSESDVPAYSLPAPLRMQNGQPLATPTDWTERRRPELLALFEEHVYGRTPTAEVQVRFDVRSVEPRALDGTATRKEIVIRMSGNGRELAADLLLYLPNGSPGPRPAFLGLNFAGNHTIHADPGITLSSAWFPEWPGIVDHRATESTRGTGTSRWPVERILSRGYALATACYHDFDPDIDDGFRNGLHPLFYRPGQERPEPGEWGSIGAWAWGLSRALDYLHSDSAIDPQRVAVIGHSRLGKTALWAGVQDPRFALVISNNSGSGGAALSRRCFGETVEAINVRFPHWFCANFHQYNGREDALPVDQHELLALVAPRPLYVASAEEDLWSDPRGEFLSALGASVVYRMLGAEGLATGKMPAVEQPIYSRIGYHLRSGKHDITAYDWDRYMDFADIHLA